MIKRFLLVSVLLLSGCEDTVSEAHFVLPPELEGCRIFYLSNQQGSNLTIARCPAITTTTRYKAGKVTKTSVVVEAPEETVVIPKTVEVDGVKYTEVVK